MTNNRIASFKILDPSAYLFDPACVFVSQDVGQLHIHFLPPNTLDHMEIGAANASAANPNNHVRLLFYFWIWHLLPGHEFRISNRVQEEMAGGRIAKAFPGEPAGD